MNNIRNRVQLIGNLGADTQLKATSNGSHIANARIATKEVYTNKAGEKVTDTQWHNLVAFGKNAETLAQYGKKGKELAVNGKLTHRSYADSSGTKRYFTEVVIQEFVLLR